MNGEAGRVDLIDSVCNWPNRFCKIFGENRELMHSFLVRIFLFDSFLSPFMMMLGIITDIVHVHSGNDAAYYYHL